MHEGKEIVGRLGGRLERRPYLAENERKRFNAYALTLARPEEQQFCR
jgi:hypothetical protein